MITINQMFLSLKQQYHYLIKQLESINVSSLDASDLEQLRELLELKRALSKIDEKA